MWTRPDSNQHRNPLLRLRVPHTDLPRRTQRRAGQPPRASCRNMPPRLAQTGYFKPTTTSCRTGAGDPKGPAAMPRSCACAPERTAGLSWGGAAPTATAAPPWPTVTPHRSSRTSNGIVTMSSVAAVDKWPVKAVPETTFRQSWITTERRGVHRGSPGGWTYVQQCVCLHQERVLQVSSALSDSRFQFCATQCGAVRCTERVTFSRPWNDSSFPRSNDSHRTRRVNSRNDSRGFAGQAAPMARNSDQAQSKTSYGIHPVGRCVSFGVLLTTIYTCVNWGEAR